MGSGAPGGRLLPGAVGKVPLEATVGAVAGMRDRAINHSEPATNKRKKINAASTGTMGFADPSCADLVARRDLREMIYWRER